MNQKRGINFSQLLAKLFFYLNIAFILSLFFYSLLPQAFESRRAKSTISLYNGHHQEFEALVCQEALISEKTRTLVLCLNEEQRKGRVLVITNLYPSYNYGDYLIFKGKLSEPKFLEDFDYPKHLAKDKIFSLSYFPQLELSENNLSFKQRLKKRLIIFKQRLHYRLNRNIPEPEAALASAMLFAYKKSISKNDLNTFSRVGIRHLIAISGLHVAIFSSLLLSILSFIGLSRRSSLVLVLIFLIIYPIMTGLAASALRASLMGGLTFLALYFGRNKNTFRLLLISASLILLFKPMLLFYDIGFQLSFLAILGIIYSEAILKKHSSSIIDKSFSSKKNRMFANFIFSIINMSLAAQLLSWPIMFSNFDQFSLISPLANIFIISLLPLILLSLIIAFCLSALVPALSLYFFWPSYLCLRYIYFISEKLSQFKLAAISPPRISLIFIVLYYLVIIFYLIRRKRLNKKPLL